MTLPAPYASGKDWTLYHGDCRALLPHLPKVDAVITDPPYGIGKRLTNGGATRHFSSMVNSGADKWDVACFQDVLEWCIQNTAAQLIFGGNFYALPPCKKPICWNKLRPNQRNLSEWEYAWTSLEGRAEMFTYCGNGGFIAKENREHPTQKPVAVMQWCLRFFPGAYSILDHFTGSGTTGVACLRLGRKFIGVEIEERYCEIAAKRMHKAEREAAEALPFGEVV